MLVGIVSLALVLMLFYAPDSCNTGELVASPISVPPTMNVAPPGPLPTLDHDVTTPLQPTHRPLPRRRTMAPTIVDPCVAAMSAGKVPNPKITFLYKERKSDLSYELVHYISIDNYLDYSDELFSASPANGHRSCDAGEDSSYM